MGSRAASSRSSTSTPRGRTRRVRAGSHSSGPRWAKVMGRVQPRRRSSLASTQAPGKYPSPGPCRSSSRAWHGAGDDAAAAVAALGVGGATGDRVLQSAMWANRTLSQPAQPSGNGPTGPSANSRTATATGVSGVSSCGPMGGAPTHPSAAPAGSPRGARRRNGHAHGPRPNGVGGLGLVVRAAGATARHAGGPLRRRAFPMHRAGEHFQFDMAEARRAELPPHLGPPVSAGPGRPTDAGAALRPVEGVVVVPQPTETAVPRHVIGLAGRADPFRLVGAFGVHYDVIVQVTVWPLTQDGQGLPAPPSVTVVVNTSLGGEH